MDKGAHFYKCDFQVHTPRDRSWSGSKYGLSPSEIQKATDEEIQNLSDRRKQFAKEYLAKIRDKGLNAVAITDHHDVCFSKIIREVAQDENKKYDKSSSQIITVFPGIELTLSNPVCQCLLLFDADFSDRDLDAVLLALGLNPSDELEERTAETERISQQHVNDLSALHTKLDHLAYCKGRYIVLPNVSNSGTHSILRRGFHEHYRTMPCKGGYVDKDISNDSGYQNKLNGGDVNYGNKSIAVISTSDNRHEDGRELGKYSTWIKWAEPTAEALRQACLAKESRISQNKPEIPQIFIKSVDITTSKFLGSFDINLNRQYNALIGGRGTGKSTILEYIRWGLCDQTLQLGEADDLSLIEKRREALIDKTLKSVDGEVRITMEKNGIQHIVKRKSNSREILLKIGESDFEQATEDDIRKILPIHAYSQKQLSDVGVKIEELKRFIEQPISTQLATLKSKIKENGSKLKVSYSEEVRKREIKKEIEDYSLETQSLNTQANKIRKSISGLSTENQRIIDQKSKYEGEAILVSNFQHDLSSVQNKIEELSKVLATYPSPLEEGLELVNKDIIEDLEREQGAVFNEIKLLASQLEDAFHSENMKQFNAKVDLWNSRKIKFEISYETAKAESKSSQQQLQEIRKIEERLSEINILIAERKFVLKDIGETNDIFSELRDKWQEYHYNKVDLLNEQAKIFTQLSRKQIKAEVAKNINLASVKTILKNLFTGLRIREDRIDDLINYVKESDDPISQYVSLLEELRSLGEVKVSEDKNYDIPDTHILSECGFSNEQKSKLCKKITPDDWLTLATIELEFDPEFYYRTDNRHDDVIPFADASAGQQATALLTVLLNQPGIPLLIDQPEDDIDNRAIDQIIGNIWNAKKKRQLLFTSHNANLVVNGDAELVVCCDYRDAMSQTRGVIVAEGAIDKKVVRDEITSVMEGGERAFRLRQDKYGF